MHTNQMPSTPHQDLLACPMKEEVREEDGVSPLHCVLIPVVLEPELDCSNVEEAGEAVMKEVQ